MVSFATKLLAADSKAIYRPSPLIEPKLLEPLAWVPPVATLIRSVVLAVRSRTKISLCPLVSFATKLVALLLKVIYRPSSLIESKLAWLLAWVPLVATLIRSVVLAVRSRTKISREPLVSFATRLLAIDSKATYLPSSLIVLKRFKSLAWVPSVATLTLSVVLAVRS